jgi:hypothetical protein
MYAARCKQCELAISRDDVHNRPRAARHGESFDAFSERAERFRKAQSGRGVCVECGEFLCDEQSTESTYHRDSVQRLIDSDPTISKNEAKKIHRLLAGWRLSQ